MDHNGFLLSGRQRLHGQQPAGDDEWWEYFPCPYCYIEVEVPLLCHHLQEEHCFDMRNAVCPVCADNLGADTAGHFRDRHSQLLKRRKSASAAGKETCGEEEDDDHSPDPLIFQFICGVAAPPCVDSGHGNTEDEEEVEEVDQRLDQVAMDDASRQELEERLRRIEFVEQMLMTTIARD